LAGVGLALKSGSNLRVICGCAKTLPAVVGLVLGMQTWIASPAAAAPTSAAERLVATYAPIVMMRSQRHGPCDDSEEQYEPPGPVSTVLGNPAVRLMRNGKHRPHEIKRGPTVADIAGLGAHYYLDLRGDPLDAGCTYARDLAAMRRAGRVPAVTYARIAREAGHPGVALQYWFFYYFNNFNDVHEGDWEGMQLAFHGSTPTEALSESPYEIVVFQHAGGEHADWDDDKVRRDGTHPVVYSASGSHATFYGSSIYLGVGQNGSGVGCDDTSEPLTQTRPRPILVPDTPRPRGEFAWLTYTGHWGQREPGFNDGPTGANTKTVWRKPFSWMDGTRDSSPTLPTSSLLGPTVSNVFCGAVARVSAFLNFKDKTRAGAIALGLILILIVVVPPMLTKWRPVSLEPLRQVRAVGQLLLCAGRLYGRYFGRLALIALSIWMIVTIVDNVAYLVLHTFASGGSGVNASDAGERVLTAGSSQFGRILIAPLGSAAVIAFVRNLEREEPAGFVAAWRAVLTRAWRVLAVGWLSSILVVLLALTIIGIPYAIRKYVDWQLVQQEVLFEDKSIRDALRGSSRVVHGHWWHTSVVAFIFWLLIEIPPLLGFALLFITVPAEAVDALGTVIFTLLIPYEAAGRTLLYLDLSARRAADASGVREVSRRQRWAERLRLGRPAPVGRPSPEGSEA
jgi:hypothetical protein